MTPLYLRLHDISRHMQFQTHDSSKHMTIQRKVLTAIMTVTTIVVLLFAVPLVAVLERLLDDRAIASLEHRADVAARSIDLTDPADKPEPTELSSRDYRSALYSPAGVRTFGVGPPSLESRLRSSPTGSRSTIESGHDRVTSVRVMSGEKTLGYVRVARDQRTLDRAITLAIAALAATALVVLCIGFVLGRRLSKKIGRSALLLSAAATRLGDGDFTSVFTATGVIEFDSVGAALTTTSKKIGDLIDREQAFTADASHQLRTPITALKTALETEIAFPRTQRVDILHEAISEVDRLQSTVTDLLALARAEQQGSREFDVYNVSRAAATHWNVDAQRQGRRVVSTDYSKNAFALGNPGLLRQALDAVLENSLTHGLGAVTITVSSDDHAVTLTVSDEGPGFQLADSQGQPNFGLGLPLVQRLVRAQGGRLVIGYAHGEPQVQLLLRIAPSSVTDAQELSRRD